MRVTLNNLPRGTAALLAIVAEELALAKALHAIVRRDSRIGFEAANHYSYTANDLAEKMVQCEWLRRQLAGPGARGAP